MICDDESGYTSALNNDADDDVRKKLALENRIPNRTKLLLDDWITVAMEAQRDGKVSWKSVMPARYAYTCELLRWLDVIDAARKLSMDCLCYGYADVDAKCDVCKFRDVLAVFDVG